MATVTASTNNIAINGADGKAILFTWSPLTTANAVGSAVKFLQGKRFTVQTSGVFGAAPATVILEGSNDGVAWLPLSDTANAAITGTAAYLKQVGSYPLYYRPNSSGGDANTAVTVTLLAAM
jgi:hypothetical protein